MSTEYTLPPDSTESARTHEEATQASQQEREPLVIPEMKKAQAVCLKLSSPSDTSEDDESEQGLEPELSSDESREAETNGVSSVYSVSQEDVKEEARPSTKLFEDLHEQIIARRKELAEVMGLDSSIANDEDNWIEDPVNGMPKYQPLPPMGNYAQHVKNNVGKTKEEVQTVVNRMKKRYSALLQALPLARMHRDVVKKGLDDILNFDVGVGVAVDEIAIDLEAAGLPSLTPSTVATLTKTQERIESLLLVQTFIRASGLTLYEDEIMEAFIPTVFSNRSISRNDILEAVKSYAKG